jgi:hypothetical protein
MVAPTTRIPFLVHVFVEPESIWPLSAHGSRGPAQAVNEALKRKTPRVRAARRNSRTLIYAIKPIADGAQGTGASMPAIHGVDWVKGSQW